MPMDATCYLGLQTENQMGQTKIGQAKNPIKDTGLI